MDYKDMLLRFITYTVFNPDGFTKESLVKSELFTVEEAQALVNIESQACSWGMPFIKYRQSRRTI